MLRRVLVLILLLVLDLLLLEARFANGQEKRALEAVLLAMLAERGLCIWEHVASDKKPSARVRNGLMQQFACLILRVLHESHAYFRTQIVSKERHMNKYRHTREVFVRFLPSAVRALARPVAVFSAPPPLAEVLLLLTGSGSSDAVPSSVLSLFRLFPCGLGKAVLGEVDAGAVAGAGGAGARGGPWMYE